MECKKILTYENIDLLFSVFITNMSQTLFLPVVPTMTIQLNFIIEDHEEGKYLLHAEGLGWCRGS